MGIIARQSVKNGIVNYAGVLLGAMSVFFVYSLDDNIYGLAQFIYNDLFDNIWYVAQIINPFCSSIFIFL